jgi:hypothetical protein
MGHEKPTVTAEKSITSSIGMKLAIIPVGEFKMGSAESAEDTAAFLNKTCRWDCLAEGASRFHRC